MTRRLRSPGTPGSGVRHTRLPALLAGLAVVTVTTGCGPDLRAVPMTSLVPGPTYDVVAVFDTALNLPEDAPVKLDGRTVGQVGAVTVREFQAVVTLEVSDDVELREGTQAHLRLSSPMGTSFVDLVPAEQARGALLRDGSRIEQVDTLQAPDVNDLLTSLSVLVNGGPFGDVRTIMTELNTALADGGATRVRRLVRRLETTVTSLNDHAADFDRALAGLDRLTRRLVADRRVIARGIREITPLVEMLDEQQGQLRALATEIRRFSRTGRRTLDALGADLTVTLRSLGPVLESLHRSRAQIVPVMKGLVLFAEKSDRAAPGDFANFDLTIPLDPQDLVAPGGSLADEQEAGGQGAGGSGTTPPSGLSGAPDLFESLSGLLLPRGGQR